MKRFIIIIFMAFVSMLRMSAQFMQGVVTDASTGETLPGVHVYYQDNMKTLVTSNINGRYKIAFRKGGSLVFSMMGYDTQVVETSSAQKLNVKMVESSSSLKQVEVTSKRRKYVRKDNPAVLLMQKVIEAKKSSDLHQHDYCSFIKYEKMTTALNEFTPKVFEDDHFKRFPFLKDHVEKCPETGKLILPLIVDEKVSRNIYRKSSNTEKTIVTGQRSEGINDLINTGDIVSSMLTDCFTDVDIYQNDVRLFQHPFLSPISSGGAIRFYRYYLADTVMVDNDKCYQVEFSPNNLQDFGFSGVLWVMADSTYRIKRAHLGIPSRSDVNFVEHMDIIQDFSTLPTGEQVVLNNRMIVQLKLASWIQKAQVERTVKYSNFDFSAIPDRDFDFSGNVKTESSAQMRDEAFWEAQRPTPLTQSEGKMNTFMQRIQSIKGFKEVLWVAKAFIENFVETSVDPKHPSKIDIGPVNTTFTKNFVEGFKLRASAQTTANLNKHWFGKGYVGYGFGDRRWKGLAELNYAINPKDYLPREFPKNNITAHFFYDVYAPSDRFIQTDKDNVFASFKWTRLDHMMYVQRFQLQYDREWENGMHFTATARRERSEGAGALFFQPLHATAPIGADGWGMPHADFDGNHRYLTTTDLSLAFEYQPNASWINTKQRRLKTNHDTPVMGVSHTIGFKGLVGGEYDYNLTEFTFYKRFWLRTWGKFDIYAKAQCQWNKVPFPLLCFPVANLSYVMEDNTYKLIDNMEFITDRNATVMLSWDFNGKFFNRIPLLKNLKWREYIGCNLFFGHLSDKNNPFLPQNADDGRLFYFPGHYNEDGSFAYNSQLMQARRPYVELIAGIHNIFKLLHVEYVRRINYLRPDTHRWGIRFMFRAQF
ncbi:MAG: DUF5686 and carboxypeptidase regulatory-like domain-containing protein [Bacteroidaceae bacterium]|nr:DUF5686 and carboxypeptidase regulatory-like domain-containing protein [Bacteroidaceae bacterium]